MRLVAAALTGWLSLTAAAQAGETAAIGAIWQASGDAGTRLAIETAADIVNTPHPGLDKLPLGAGRGLPHLGGAKLALSFADDLGNPSVAQSQALRLIAHDHVAALIGAGEAPQILAASALAERHGIPLLVPVATAPGITGSGFQWVFRTTPLAGDIARVYAQFLGALKQGGGAIDTIALVFEDSDWGRSSASVLRDALTAGFAVADIAYPPNATDLSAAVGQLRARNPGAAIFVSHAAEAILFVKTMKTLNYKPPFAIGDVAGFSDPAFVASVGNLAQGLIGRSVWSAGPPDSPAAIINELYKAKSGRDLDDSSARAMQGVFVLADAIDRAGSADPAAIQTSLRETDLKPDRLIVGYDGVAFDAAGQNRLGATYLTQLQARQYVPVWPAGSTTGKLLLPFKGWE